MGRRCAGNALLLLFGLVAAALLGELALRLLVDEGHWTRPFSPGPWTWVVTDPLLGWVNRPGVASAAFRINALGFRGPELSVEKPRGVIRIACLGDSSTFGLWRDGPQSLAFDSYVEILAERLAASGRHDVEVLNAGVLGYSSANGLRQLATRIRDLAPSVVVARFGFNDHGLAYEPQFRVAEPAWRLQRALLYAFADWKLLRLALQALRRLPGDAGPFQVRWVEPEDFERNLRRLGEMAADGDFELLLMDYPLRRLERGESPGAPIGAYPEYGVKSVAELHAIHERYQQILRRTAREAGIPLLRTEPACRLPGDPCFGTHDVVHLSRFGAELHARLIHEELLKRGWLAPPDEQRPD